MTESLHSKLGPRDLKDVRGSNTEMLLVALVALYVVLKVRLSRPLLPQF